MLSIVIPAWNAAAHIPRTLAALKACGIAGEIVVADANSSDGTAAEAARLGARVVAAARGRGVQLHAGAAAAHPDRGASFNARGDSPAHGDWLLFLHADTVPGPGFAAAVTRFIADPANQDRAGFFRLRFADPTRAARIIEWLANWRAHMLGLPYGDQGLLLSRALYDRTGGFPPFPIMEDVAMVRRLGRRRLVQLDAELVTSAERYRRDGYLVRPLRNLVCLALYFLGVAPARIARIYD
ncbi:MAG: glycosyltransferase family 2 protein [Pseudomonadota bacterium]